MKRPPDLNETDFGFTDEHSAPAAPAVAAAQRSRPNLLLLLRVEQVLDNVVRGAAYLRTKRIPAVSATITAGQVEAANAAADELLSAYTALQSIFVPPRRQA